jgi:CubicO group peptidase (beta-lactamase class C family)
MRTAPPLTLLLAMTARLAAGDAVDDYVRAEMARQRIPGVSLALCRDGQPVKAQGYGLANVEHQVPAKPETVYQSGSVGKQFTATAVMMLVEEGKLGLDDPIARYFEGAPNWWQGVTVRQLLSHTSGIKDYGEPEIDYRKDYTEEEFAQVAMQLPPDFPPGTQWSYSNTGYALLGFLIHKLSGKFYGDFLQERVFGPLGMSSTRVISESDIVPNRAAGYRLEQDELKNQRWVSPSLNTTADGALYLTVLDLAKWDTALRGERLLKRTSLAQMWTPVALTGSGARTYHYGFGWSIDEQRGRTLIEHGGSWQGFRAAIARYLDDGLSVVVLSNLAQADPEVISHGVAGVLEPTLRLPNADTPSLDPDPGRTARLREVLQAWARAEPSPHMAPALAATSAGSAREQGSRKRTAERLEKLTSFSFLGVDALDRPLERHGERVGSIAYYGLATDKESFLYRFYLTGTGAVADFASEQRR